ncbi:MAG: PulJ/GspJ family protein [Cellvibrionaceae bacterium]
MTSLVRRFQQRNRGFTLLEMITVIVILSLTTIASTRIIISIVEGQALVKKHSQVLIESQLTMDRLAKQLQTALPFSLRESNANRCLSFMPVVASSFYLSELPDSINLFPTTGASVPVPVAPYAVSGGNAAFFSVGAQSSAELYGSGATSLESITSLSASAITLNQDHRWQQNSPEQRFFIIDRPQAFCVVNNELRYYRNVSQTNADINLNGLYDVLMNTVNTSGRIFTIADGLTGCQHCIDIQLQFTVDNIQQVKNRTVSLFYAR